MITMNNYKIGLMKLFFLCFVFSCGTIKTRKIEKSQNSSIKLAKKLSVKNGNAFYVYASYSSNSYTWTYSSGGILLYEIIDGKTSKEYVFESGTDMNWLSKFPREESFELDECMELDGNVFGFIIKDDSEFFEQSYPVDLNCLSSEKIKSVFFNNVATDLKKLELY